MSIAKSVWAFKLPRSEGVTDRCVRCIHFGLTISQKTPFRLVYVAISDHRINDLAMTVWDSSLKTQSMVDKNQPEREFGSILFDKNRYSAR
ncbi:hypothetical protein ACFL0M_03235 [Thermodesulfobacteriota bacterium]